MTKKRLTTPLVITRFSSKADGALSITAITPVLSSEEKVALMSLQGSELIVSIEAASAEAEAPVEVKGVFETKTPSQRLRNSIYALWQERQPAETFEDFYKKWMEKVIGAIKVKLPPRQ